MKKKIPNILLLILTLFTTLILAEAAVRICFPRAKECVAEDKYKPSSSFIKLIEEKTGEKLNFRGKWDLDQPKKMNEKRILFLGDSFLYCVSTPYDKLMTTRIEEYLNEQSNDDTIFEVFNAGMSGLNTEFEFFMLKLLYERISPDLVVVCYMLNDADRRFKLVKKGDEEYIMPGNPAFSDGDIVSENIMNRITDYLNFRSRFFAFIKSRLNYLKVRWKSTFQYQDFHISLYGERNKAGLEEWEEAFANFGKFSKEHDIPIIFVVFPLFTNLDESYPYSKIHEMVKEQCLKNDLYCYDTLPLYWKRKAYALWVDIDDAHPNALANEIAAMGIYNFLTNRTLLTAGGTDENINN